MDVGRLLMPATLSSDIRDGMVRHRAGAAADESSQRR
ncbi:hypothetical protein SUDANB91_06937 [Streptomyces sp. SudanB91_2054]